MKKNRLIFAYDHLEEIILVMMFVVMVAITFIQIIMRYVFNNSLSWTEEMARLLFVWLTWLGISIGVRKGEHIKITIMVDKLSFRVAHVTNIISDIFVIFVCFVTAYYGAYLTMFMAGSKYVAIGISYSWGYACIPVGCILMILRTLGSTWRSMKELKTISTIIEDEEGGTI